MGQVTTKVLKKRCVSDPYSPFKPTSRNLLILLLEVQEKCTVVDLNDRKEKSQISNFQFLKCVSIQAAPLDFTFGNNSDNYYERGKEISKTTNITVRMEFAFYIIILAEKHCVGPFCLLPEVNIHSTLLQLRSAWNFSLFDIFLKVISGKQLSVPTTTCMLNQLCVLKATIHKSDEQCIDASIDWLRYMALVEFVEFSNWLEKMVELINFMEPREYLNNDGYYTDGERFS